MGNLSQKRNGRIAKSNKETVISLFLLYGTGLIKAKLINFTSNSQQCNIKFSLLNVKVASQVTENM